MVDVAASVWWLIVVLGILVTLHEYGHFWTARRAGVKVLRFSIGFGPILASRKASDGVEYALSALPLGGYVKMLDEREGEVAPEEQKYAFNRASLGKRAAIVAAGPIANLVIAVVVFWLMFMVGVREVRPLVGEVEGIASAAGLRAGDLIVSIDGRETATLTRATLALLEPALDDEPVSLQVEDRLGSRREVTLPLDELPQGFSEERLWETVGIRLWRPRIEPRIGAVLPDSPADRAGLQAGDLLLQANGVAIDDFRGLVDVVQQADIGDPLALRLRRDDRDIELSLVPERIDGAPRLGIEATGDMTQADREQADRFETVLRYGPFEAVGEAVQETYRLSIATLGMFGRMLIGRASLDNLSGPVTIANYARDSARIGLSRFLFFLGVVSLSLAILNFLPIPLLDGGHLLYFAIEWIKGSPVSLRMQEVGAYVGMLLLFALMSRAFYNDILRVMS